MEDLDKDEQDVLEDEELDQETQEPEDRGDDFEPTDDEELEVTGEEDDDPPAKAEEEEEEEDLDPEALRKVAEGEHEDEDEDDVSAIPVARAGEISKEKNFSQDIGDAIVNGEIKPDTIKDLGGTKAVAKALLRGDITMEQLQSGEVKVEDEQGESEPYDFVDAAKRLNALNLEGDVEAADALVEEIETQRQSLIERMAEEKAEEKLTSRDKAKEAETVGEAALSIIDRHEELVDGSQELLDFYDWRDVALMRGYGTVEALLFAEEKVFGTAVEPDKDVGKDAAKERKKEAVKRNLESQEQQPPKVTEKGKGVKDSYSRKEIADMDDDEFDALPESVKKAERGD